MGGWPQHFAAATPSHFWRVRQIRPLLRRSSSWHASQGTTSAAMSAWPAATTALAASGALQGQESALYLRLSWSAVARRTAPRST
jgi:hypothetical protein